MQKNVFGDSKYLMPLYCVSYKLLIFVVWHLHGKLEIISS